MLQWMYCCKRGLKCFKTLLNGAILFDADCELGKV